MRYLGLDLGTKTCGVALSDKTKTIASFYKNINYKEEDVLIKEICEIAEQEEVEKIILGFPKNMNNTIGPKGELSLEFKSRLENILSIPVYLEDERLTTVTANNVLISGNVSRKNRKKVVDSVAATIILQGYLDRSGKR